MSKHSKSRNSKLLVSIFSLLIAVAGVTSSTNATAQSHGSLSSIEAYHQRIQVESESDLLAESFVAPLTQVPPDFQPWWSAVLQNRLRANTSPSSMDLDSLLVRTLEHSSQIKVFSDLPAIRRTSIIEAGAAFDWTSFLNTRWDDLSDPVGNVLTTGGSSRYRNNQWSGAAGLYRKNTAGGRFEVAQELGFQNTNSTFFQPNNQGTSRLRLSYVQPLKRGRGTVYNTSLIVLAKIDTAIAEDEFSRQLQSHLLEVTRAYWSLHLERVALIQKQQLYLKAEELQRDLQGRIEVDVVGSQLLRVDAALTERKADLIRAEMAVRNAQDRIHALVNDPELALTPNLEIIPTNTPLRVSEPFTIDEILTTALQQRPEVNQALKQIQAASVRLCMSRNELLPQLDLIAETYVAGLRGNSNIGNAWTDQFTEGEPSYAVGLQYEFPIGNRAAEARLKRRQLELRQLQNQFRTTVETLLMEAKVAAREVRTSEREFNGKYAAMQAASRRTENIQERWAHLPSKERSFGLYLEDLLNSQVAETQAEYEFAKAETTYNLALTNLKRATGTLLQTEHIVQGETCIAGLPTKVLDKDAATDQQTHVGGGMTESMETSSQTSAPEVYVAPLPMPMNSQ